MSALASDPRTSFTAEKLGLPLSTIISAAALVSPRRLRTSKISALGRSCAHFSRAGSLTASAASSSSTDGSSSVRRDFSNSS